MIERLDAIYAIAQHRAAYSFEEDAAHELAAAWMREAGLEVSRDEAGNLFGTRGDARVPQKVTVSVDARSADGALLDTLVDDIGFHVRWKSDPVPMGDAFAAVLPDAPRLVSGAGHDAMFVPNASMLFVRSLNGGVSHHPDELSSGEDIALGVDALTAALDRLTRWQA
jgi:acetylornithine deacetylase/succinyl-diaminopimelate desuccinylase-like protein